MRKRTTKRKTIGLLLVLAVALTACGKNAPKEETQEIVTETVELQEVEESQASLEDKGESVEEATTYETPEEWVDSLNLDTPTILIWNSETKENKIMEENEEYELKEDDKVLLTTSARFDAFKCIPSDVMKGFVPVKQKYMELSLDVKGEQEVTFELERAGEKYANTVVLIGTPIDTQEDLILAKEDIDVNSDLPGEEWIASIGNNIEEPFIAIWNDVDGSKKILENGEGYQLKDDDVFFLYFPEFHLCEYFTPLQISTNITQLDNGQIMEIDKNYIQKETLVIFSVKEAGEPAIEVSCILTK